MSLYSVNSSSRCVGIGEDALLGELILERAKLDFVPAVLDALGLRDELGDFLEFDFKVGLAAGERGAFEFALLRLAFGVVHFLPFLWVGTPASGSSPS